MKVATILSHLAALLLASCDYVDTPVEGPGPGPGPEEGVTRRVLIEDFTGFRCPNCPAATQVALQLQGIYGEDQLIVMGLHVTDVFAAPVPPLDDGVFDTDFRTPAGDELATSFGVSFLPVGPVSRREFNSSLLLGSAGWSSAVSEIIGTPSHLDLWFDTLSYDPGTGEINTTVKLAVLAETIGDHKLVVCLTEDHVVDDQIDNTQTPPEVPDYDHRHVLRDNLNGTWGEVIIAASASTGDTLELSYVRPLAAFVLEPNNCTLVAYVYDAASGEILQVAQREFNP